MDLSPLGRAVLVAREGRRLSAYRDSAGIWTIGIGHTGAAGPPKVTPELRLTAAEGDALFDRDVVRFTQAVRGAVPADLPQHAFDALVSLCFNIGQSAFLRSTVVRRLKAGERDGAAEAILMWNRPAAVIARRQAEYDQFRTPYSITPPAARRGEAVSGAAPHPRPSGRRPMPRLGGPAPRPDLPAPPAPAGLWGRLVARLRRLP